MAVKRPVSSTPAPATAPKAAPAVFQDFVTEGGADSVEGSGGVAMFWLAPLDLDGATPMYDQAVRFDMLPARNSFFERQGQRVPEVGAGLDIQTTFNLAKLKIPGGRPVYQQMGVDEESIEMVGAFAGFDVESYEETVYSTNGVKRNAFSQARELLEKINQGRPMAILMSTGDWTGKSAASAIQFVNFAGQAYRGFVRRCRVVYAHEQRIYWKLHFAIINRDDVGGLNYSANVNTPESMLGVQPESTQSETTRPVLTSKTRENAVSALEKLETQRAELLAERARELLKKPSGYFVKIQQEAINRIDADIAGIDRAINQMQGVL